MTFEEYRKFVMSKMAQLPSLEANNLHAVIGLATEVGELQDIHKKWLAYKKPIDTINQREEVGDILFYLTAYMEFNGLTLEEVIDSNMRKLNTRYGTTFDESKALTRDLDAERKALS